MSGPIAIRLPVCYRMALLWQRFCDARRGLIRCAMCAATCAIEAAQDWRYLSGTKGAGWICPGCSPLAANHGGAQ
jgi:hypothetical protein